MSGYQSVCLSVYLCIQMSILLCGCMSISTFLWLYIHHMSLGTSWGTSVGQSGIQVPVSIFICPYVKQLWSYTNIYRACTVLLITQGFMLNNTCIWCLYLSTIVCKYVKQWSCQAGLFAIGWCVQACHIMYALGNLQGWYLWQTAF